MKKIFLLIMILFIIINCSKKEEKFDSKTILSSQIIAKEVEIFEKFNIALSNQNISDEEVKSLLNEAIVIFKEAKIYFESLKTEDANLKDAITNQIEMCKIYENIEKIIVEKNDFQPALKNLYFANKYYNNFLDAMSKAEEKELADGAKK